MQISSTGIRDTERELLNRGLAYVCQSGTKGAPNQDDMCLISTENISVLGVFDGHGAHGHFCAYIVQQMLPKFLLANHSDMRTALTESFHFAGEALKDIAEKQGSYSAALSGTTATLVVVKNQQLYTGHVGDSRAVLARLSPKNILESIELTHDHTLSTESEKNRVLASKGEVRKADSSDIPRFYFKGTNYPGLAMSRSLGDEFCKPYGISSQPDISAREITERDLFVVVCSDGVWEKIGSSETVQIVHGFGKKRVQEAARCLVDEAHKRWSDSAGDWCDDITGIVYYLH